jgi:hypothetical protein
VGVRFHLSFWIRSIPITGEASLDRHEELARYPLAKMQPAIRSFWRAYATNIDRSPDNVQERLLRATRFAAARLVQTAVETLQYAVNVPPNVVCLLQLSVNMLQRPSDASRDILGIVWEGPSCLNSFVN